MQIKMNELSDYFAGFFHCLFIRDNGRWHLDCSTWDRKEALILFHNDVSALKNKKLVSLSEDSETTIAKARNYINHVNTPSFVKLEF